ncbi:MaoC/PaaZ C-terminal domain-containing protein [Xanthobacter autotrophicus]|uniref:MaoC/PaaZ C-terminal domain-containing protein n=1 Tax=Xanthobacter autotrophicus TaxID=280 RepID=UPI003729E86C
MIYKPYGQLAVGDATVSNGRTLTESDVVNFCMLTGNWLELHSNKEFAAHTRFGQRIVQGSMVFSIGNALLPFEPSLVEAFYGVDRLRFLRPSFIGDTIWSRAEIKSLRDRGADHGVATLDLRVANQRDEVVMSCDFSLLVRRTPLHSQATPSFSDA